MNNLFIKLLTEEKEREKWWYRSIGERKREKERERDRERGGGGGGGNNTGVHQKSIIVESGDWLNIDNVTHICQRNKALKK